MGTKWPRFFGMSSDAYVTVIMSRVAVWFIFKPKIPLWVNFEGKMLKYLSGRFEYFTDILYIL
jgi:hypothetical protein